MKNKINSAFAQVDTANPDLVGKERIKTNSLLVHSQGSRLASLLEVVDNSPEVAETLANAVANCCGVNRVIL